MTTRAVRPQRVLGATSGHGGDEYERLLVDGELVMQLHRLEVGHHHGTIGDPDLRSATGWPGGSR